LPGVFEAVCAFEEGVMLGIMTDEKAQKGQKQPQELRKA